jgi:histidyl-tRNA synthetase
VTWRESRPAQITVKEEGLVEAVREILSSQAQDRAQAAK